MWNTVMLVQGQPPKPQDSHVLVKHDTRIDFSDSHSASHVLVKHDTRIDYQLVVVRSVHRESLTSFIKTRCANRLPTVSRKLLRLSI